jgi:hypothetical protein
MWQAVIQALTIVRFEELWKTFSDKYPQTLEYIQRTWIKPGQKERLLTAYTNNHLHFGVRVTSRVEGAHAYIKQYLGKYTNLYTNYYTNYYIGSKKRLGGLFTTWMKIETAIQQQIQDICTTTLVQRIATPLNLDRKLYKGCFRVIT